MTINKQQTVTIRELIANYKDNGDAGGVVAWGGLLNARPAYQREYVYSDEKRDAVIETVVEGYPLGLMYWVKSNDGSGMYEILDGQQRALSICRFFANEFSYKFEKGTPLYAHSIPNTLKQKMLNYELDVRFCDGTDEEKLKWFKKINVAGSPLTDQELLNINYTGPWLSDAKRYFSTKSENSAYKYRRYLNGDVIRQAFLKIALDWISGGNIADYMAKHKNDKNADELWNYFQKVIEWIESIFPVYREQMKGLNWGKLYREYSANTYNPDELEKKVSELMACEEIITNKKGIYEFLLSGEAESKARKLQQRAFDKGTKRTAYERQKGICPICGKHFEYSEMEGDHIRPWWRGGLTVLDNCQMLCKKCNHEKAGRLDLKGIDDEKTEDKQKTRPPYSADRRARPKPGDDRADAPGNDDEEFRKRH